MSKDEIANYNYLYNVSGRKAANEYLAYLKNDLTQRRQAEIAETHRKLATEHPGWADLYSVGATLASGIGLLDIAGQNAVKGIKEAITGEYAGPINYSSAAMNPNTIATSIRSTRAQNIANKYGVIDINPEDHPFWAKILNGKSFGDVYQLGMSMADSAAVLAMSPILGSYGTVLLGGSAGTQGVINALQNGATDEQALAMGVLNGFFEMFFEKFSLETLLSSNGRRFIDALWRQAVAEGSEELFTSAANNVADIIVMAEKSGYMKNVAYYIEAGSSESEAMQKALLDMGIDMSWDFVGGLISGGIMGGGGKVLTSAKSTIENAEIGKSIMKVDGGVDALMNHANEVAVVNQADVAKSLRSKGAYSKDVDGIAEAIVARLNGQEMTRRQRSTLSFALNSSAVRDTISEFINRRKASTEQSSPEQRKHEFLEATDLPKLHEKLVKTGFPWEHGKAADKLVELKFKEILEKAENNDRIELDESTEEVIAGKSFEQLLPLRKKIPDRAVRKWYIAQDAQIPLLIDRTLPLEDQARQACDLRNRNRTNARELMRDQEKRKQLDQEDPNKDFEELIADKMWRKGLTREQAIADILKTVTKTRKSVNKQLGLE